jgi:geranylgeranyl pyrophosphate synthase
MPYSHFRSFRSDLGLIEEQLSESLFDPLHDFLSRPRKSVRSQLLQIGFELGGGSEPTIEQEDLIRRAVSALEGLHAGSMIIGDARDEAHTRRGQPCLHVQIGTPLAMNAANWLSVFTYRLILDSDVRENVKSSCVREITDTLLKTYQGQALDLSIRMSDRPLHEVPLICRQSLEWKCGALLELGLVLGARISGCEGPRLESVRMLGRELGVSLQMFEDLRQLAAEEPQHLENLMLQRPSFIWWLAAEEFPQKWSLFLSAIEMLPKMDGLASFLKTSPLLQKGRARAVGHQRWTFQNFAALGGDLTSPAFQRIEKLADRLSEAEAAAS